MNNKKNYPELMLLEISDRLHELEWQMTNHAFAHHYAVTSMNEGAVGEEVSEDIENFRNGYFVAREEYALLDAERLQVFEASLSEQKEILQSSSRVLH